MLDHEKIYLQHPDDAGDEGRSWCQDRVGEDDTVYVRADLFAAVTKEKDVATEGWRQGAIYNTFADKEITRLRGLLREAGEQLRITRGWYQLMQPYHMPAMKPKYEAMMDVILRITPTEGEGDEVESRNQ